MEQQSKQSQPKEENLFDKQREPGLKKEIYNPDSLKLLIKFIDFLKVKGESEIWTLFLMQERLIYTASYLMEKGIALDKLNFDFKGEVMQFVQKINLKVMEAGGTLKFEDAINLLSRPIDMLLYKPVYNKIEPFHKVLDLRILCFNNLSCIYRQNKQNKDALKAVDKAIQMEQILVSENWGDSIKNISSTYINKAVIMSELGMHLESIETIKKSLDSMEKYQKQFVNQEGGITEDSEAFQLKYLSVIAYFNLAVEHEHMFYVQYAKTFYEIALNIAKELGYTEMIRTIDNVLRKMKNTKQVNNQPQLH